MCYRGKRFTVLILDIFSIALAFVLALCVRYVNLMDETVGRRTIVSLYSLFFAGALFLYTALYLLLWKFRIEKMSKREILWMTFEQQSIFIVAYIILFFIFHKSHIISRIVIGVFYLLDLLICSCVRLKYWSYCKRRIHKAKTSDKEVFDEQETDDFIRHVYIIGAKSIGQYGGFESFVLNLLQQHKDNPNIKYHVACKANGQGCMDMNILDGIEKVNENEFTFCNASGFLISVPEKLGSAQAVYYDIRALEWACEHIERNHIEDPIVYILASRIGPFERKYVRKIHNAGGSVLQNPDGHEDWRGKWSWPIRKYWKFSEQYAVKNADLVVCDSKNIETYIQDEYAQYHPKTTYISYGAYITPSTLKDTDSKYRNWLLEHNLKDKQFYLCVGRFVPENNFDIMIREFVASHTKKSFAIITTENGKYAEELQQKLQYKRDKRIKFVGTVYDTNLLGKIRENAYGYLHGHEVGGTNPSLLEALGSTRLNLLYDVGFNKEVAEDAALYWNKEEGDLAKLIDKADKLSEQEMNALGDKAKQRIREHYSWEFICSRYAEVFLKK